MVFELVDINLILLWFLLDLILNIIPLYICWVGGKFIALLYYRYYFDFKISIYLPAYINSLAIMLVLIYYFFLNIFFINNVFVLNIK